jgi:alkylation response protein AidB-like acyl-CoA dehydrogenase
MDFSWSAEQEALRDTIAGFARQQVAPASSAIDRAGAIPSDLLAAPAKLGLLSMGLPADLGGSGASSPWPPSVPRGRSTTHPVTHNSVSPWACRLSRTRVCRSSSPST